MLPLSDGIPARRFPIVNVLLIVFAHVGGFIFGLLVARLLARAGQAAPGSNGAALRSPAGSSPRRNRRSQNARRGDARRRRIGYSQSCHKLSAMMMDSLR